MSKMSLHSRLPVTAAFLPKDFPCNNIEELANTIRAETKLNKKFPFLLELAEIEVLRDHLYQNPPKMIGEVESFQVHPGVELLEVSWSGFPELLSGRSIKPQKGKHLVLFIPQGGEIPPKVISPDNHTLLALKIVVERTNLLELAKELGVSANYLQNILALAVENGFILQPSSKIVRPTNFCVNSSSYENYLTAHVFTLQWHITQSCDLHCRHCYDRSQRKEVGLDQGKQILDQLYEFCRHHNISGQVSFTGGNPLLHPHFLELYQAAADRGFMTAILGNPTDRIELERIQDIQNLEFFQVSLEGLKSHNDYIRGTGHFDRVEEFLALLREMNIYSMVMLTLTRANQDQVLPLAERLREKVDLFTFNRLAMVGEGAALVSAACEKYDDFLQSYLEAAKNNPIMRLKDNLFNILHQEQGAEPGGGCAGHGCGAAFNFVSLLPDGQLHGCRKFPSLLGDINKNTLSSIYSSDLAKSYRMGSSACRKCEIRPVCGGCPAVTHGFGKDGLADLDPYCFLNKQA